MKYIVYATRTDHLAFEVEADSPEDAQARYLTEGREVGRSDGEVHHYRAETKETTDHHLASSWVYPDA